MVVTLGQQYNIGEKPTVMLYSYINCHAGTPDKQRRQNSTSSDNKDESNTIIETRTGDHGDVESSQSKYTTPLFTRTVFSSMSFIPNCRAEYITSSILSIVPQIFLQSVHQLHFINRSSNLLAERDCIIVLWVQ